MMAVLVHVGKKLKITHKKRKPVATINLNINLKLMSLNDERIENKVRMVYILLMNVRWNFLTGTSRTISEGLQSQCTQKK